MVWPRSRLPTHHIAALRCKSGFYQLYLARFVQFQIGHESFLLSHPDDYLRQIPSDN